MKYLMVIFKQYRPTCDSLLTARVRLASWDISCLLKKQNRRTAKYNTVDSRRGLMIGGLLQNIIIQTQGPADPPSPAAKVNRTVG